MATDVFVELDASPSSVPIARRVVRDWFASIGVDGDRASRIELCVSELVTNSVLHAYREHGTVGIEAATSGDEVVVAVSDHGPGFTLVDAKLGLAVAVGSSDALEISTANGTTRVEARFC